MTRKMKFSDDVIDAAVAALTQVLMVKVKPGKEAKFREDIRLVLEAAARAERAEAEAHWADTFQHPRETARSLLSEGLHTGWRKGTDSSFAPAIHQLISNMEGEDWGAYVSWVDWALRESGYAKEES